MNASDNVIRENGEYINVFADPVKYQSTAIVTSVTQNNNNFDGCCFAGFLLINNYFSPSDNGFYWCQIVVNLSRPLEPSSYAYISLSPEMSSVSKRQDCTVSDLTHHLSPEQCAENITTTPLSRMTCNYQSTTTTMANSQSEQSEFVTGTTTLEKTDYELVSTTVTMNTEFTNNDHDPLTVVTTNARDTITTEDNTSLLYGTIVGAFIAFTVVLSPILMCLAILFYKYTRLKKQGKL